MEKDIVKSTEWKNIDSLISLFMEIQQLISKIEKQFTLNVIQKVNVSGDLADVIKGICKYLHASHLLQN